MRHQQPTGRVDVLMDHGNAVAKHGKKLPKVVKLDFSIAQSEGLLPSQSEYEVVMKMFTERKKEKSQSF